MIFNDRDKTKNYNNNTQKTMSGRREKAKKIVSKRFSALLPRANTTNKKRKKNNIKIST
jgi:hypothetical protein